LAIRKGFLLYIKQPKSRKAITQSRVQKVIVAVNSGYEPS
jgi:plastocyanin domain-containing protein